MFELGAHKPQHFFDKMAEIDRHAFAIAPDQCCAEIADDVAETAAIADNVLDHGIELGRLRTRFRELGAGDRAVEHDGAERLADLMRDKRHGRIDGEMPPFAFAALRECRHRELRIEPRRL